MGYQITEFGQDLLDDVRKLCDRTLEDQLRAADRSGEWPAEAYRAASEMGIGAAFIAEEYGGVDLELSEQAAVLEDKLRKNPMRIVSAPKKETIQYTIYTAEELHDLFEKVKGNRLEIVVKLAGYYGLRREEICGLMWQDIDFERNLFEIRRSMTMAGGQLLIDEPKTKSSYRKEAMNDDVRELLLRLRDRQEENKRMLKDDYMDTGFILCWEDGKPYRPNYISELFTKFLNDNGLKKIRLHDLRHSFASIANDLGVPMFNISKALGHGSTAVTSGIYTHMFDDSHKETIDRVTEAIQQFKKTGKAT